MVVFLLELHERHGTVLLFKLLLSRNRHFELQQLFQQLLQALCLRSSNGHVFRDGHVPEL